MSTGRLTTGDPAPDLTVLDPEGNTTSVSPLWSNGPTVLTFLRHFG